MASDRVGNKVANISTSAASTNSQLLATVAASRDNQESSGRDARKAGRRANRNPKLTSSTRPMKMVKIHASRVSLPKACTDCTMPERVMKVPKMVRKKVRMTKTKVHRRNSPRRSCTFIECSIAVAVNQGSRPAFSTGSQAQNPPQPSTS